MSQRLPGILTISLSNFIIPARFMIFYCMLSVSTLMIELFISMFNYFSFKHLGTTAAYPFVFFSYSHFYSLLVTRRGSRIKSFLVYYHIRYFPRSPDTLMLKLLFINQNWMHFRIVHELNSCYRNIMFLHNKCHRHLLLIFFYGSSVIPKYMN